jgi:hypothetical protein
MGKQQLARGERERKLELRIKQNVAKLNFTGAGDEIQE